MAAGNDRDVLDTSTIAELAGAEHDGEISAKVSGGSGQPADAAFLDETKSLTKSGEPQENSRVTSVGVHEAKTHLSRLLRRVEAGEEILITSGGKPAARLVPVESDRPRTFGTDSGAYAVPEDFDAPLSADLLGEFEA